MMSEHKDPDDEAGGVEPADLSDADLEDVVGGRDGAPIITPY